MTETKISCSKCGGHIVFPKELAGQEIACPHCGESILLPKPSRAIVWAIVAGFFVIGVICFGVMFISQHKSKSIKPQLQPVSSIIDKNTPVEFLQNQAAKGNPKAQLILGWRYYDGEGVATNQIEATNWWAKAVEQGNTGAMIAMGDVFYEKWENENSTNAVPIDPTTGLPTAPNNTNSVNYSESLKWYGKAAELGDTNAMWKLILNGNVGSTNFGTIIDPTTGLPMPMPGAESLRWLQKLAGRGDTEAMVTMGSVYINETNANEGLNWLHKAADLGVTSAWTTLASIYESGNGGVANDIEEAVRWYTKAATNGDISSELHLAQLYRDNEEVKNPQESFKWFLKIAQQSDSNPNSWDKISIREAIVPVAMAYDKGLGVAQDKAEAIKWYTKAAEAGDTKAQWRLGVKYDLGDGVAIDKQKALQWYLKVANTPKLFGIIVLPGVAESQRNLGYLYRDGEGVPKDAQEAFNWFMKAAANGDDSSQYEVAQAYKTGVGVLQDKHEAFKWYQKAAYQGNKSAQREIGNLYGENLYSSENRIEAYKWYALAAAQGDEYAVKFRDDIAPILKAKELEEANRRAKAFSVGEPPITNNVPVIASASSTLANAAIDLDKPAFEVLNITAKPTEQNNIWWRYGYRLTVRNNGMNTDGQWFAIQFLDAQGYVIDTTTTDQTVIKPGATEIITGEKLINLPGAVQVSKLKAVWKR